MKNRQQTPISLYFKKTLEGLSTQETEGKTLSKVEITCTAVLSKDLSSIVVMNQNVSYHCVSAQHD